MLIHAVGWVSTSDLTTGFEVPTKFFQVTCYFFLTIYIVFLYFCLGCGWCIISSMKKPGRTKAPKTVSLKAFSFSLYFLSYLFVQNLSFKKHNFRPFIVQCGHGNCWYSLYLPKTIQSLQAFENYFGDRSWNSGKGVHHIVPIIPSYGGGGGGGGGLLTFVVACKQRWCSSVDDACTQRWCSSVDDECVRKGGGVGGGWGGGVINWIPSSLNVFLKGRTVHPHLFEYMYSWIWRYSQEDVFSALGNACR